MNNMLTVEEVKSYLAVEQKELEKYIQQGKLHAYKIGGSYLRFRKEEVANLRYEVFPGKNKADTAQGRSLLSYVADFWRFNNFYLIAFLLIVLAVAWMIGF